MAIPDDVRMATGFFTHPKTRKLIKALGLEGVISFQKMWIFAAQFRPKGVLYGFDEDEIEEASGWNGEPGALIATLLEVRYLKYSTGDNPGSYEIHDWKKHQPHIYFAPEREQCARDAAYRRWDKKRTPKTKKKQPVNAKGIEEGTPDSNPEGNAGLDAPSPSPSPSPIPKILVDAAATPQGSRGVSLKDKCHDLNCQNRGTIKIGNAWWCHEHADQDENPLTNVMKGAQV